MLGMYVPDPTLQFEILELKLDAKRNMYSMLFTELTFQFEMSELKLDL